MNTSGSAGNRSGDVDIFGNLNISGSKMTT